MPDDERDADGCHHDFRPGSQSEAARRADRAADGPLRAPSASVSRSTSSRSRSANASAVQLRVIAAPVEAPIDGTLDRATDGLEQGKGDKGRRGHGERVALGHTGERRLEPDTRIANAATRSPLTSAQPIVRLMIRSMSYRR